MSDERIQLGRRGEQIAASYLQSMDWKILGRNVDFRVAELDIVADDGRDIVFVEVRTLWRHDRVRAVDTVRWSKHRKLTLAARLYLGRSCLHGRFARFDVIGVDGRRGMVVDHIRGAFEATR